MNQEPWKMTIGMENSVTLKHTTTGIPASASGKQFLLHKGKFNKPGVV